MNRFALPFVALVLSAAACLPVSKAQADFIFVVAPNANTTVEGNGNSSSLFNALARTQQSAYAQSELGGIAIGSQITGLTYRADGSNSAAFPTADRTFAQYNIQLSRSRNAPVL